MNAVPPAIELAAVSFGFDTSPVLQDVDLRIERGQFASIVGPNGGGKTTLLKLVLGLLRPARGRVRVFGQAPERARPRIGYMPQHTDHDRLFPATAGDVVRMGRLRRGWPLGPFGRRDRRAASEALERVGLAAVHDRPFADLSGGQRQRVLIARALAGEPEMLLLDEPTSNIDTAAVDAFYDLLETLSRSLTVVTVTHDIGFVSSRVRSVVCVNRRVVTHPTSALTGECLRDVYGTDLHLVHHDRRCPDKPAGGDP